MMEIPNDYQAGYEKARLVDRETADNYVAHTHIGDPVMDAVVEELAPLPQRQVHKFLQAGMDQDRDGMRNAPPSCATFSSTLRSLTRTGSITTPSLRASALFRDIPFRSFRVSSPAC